MKTFVTFILYSPRLTLFFLIFKGFLISYVYASDLPSCPSKGFYHDCFGTYVLVTESKKGDKYVGEFNDNKMHGYKTSRGHKFKNTHVYSILLKKKISDERIYNMSKPIITDLRIKLVHNH